MLKAIKKAPSLTAFQEALKEEKSLFFQELWDAPKSILAAIAQKAGKSVLIVTGSERDTRLFDDLLFFTQGVTTFPAWETLPGEDIPPSSDIVGKRLEVLHAVAEGKEPQIVIAPVQAVMQKVIAKEVLGENSLTICKGDTVAFDTLPHELEKRGYVRCPVASDKGEFAVRGGLIDIYPVSSSDPVRLDFFGDDVEAIRTFDPLSQKTIGKTKEVLIPPAHEMGLLKRTQRATSLLEYFPEDTIIIFDNIIAIEDRYVQLMSLEGAQSELVLPFSEFFKEAQRYTHLFFSEARAEDLSEETRITSKGTIQDISFPLMNKTIATKRFNHSFVKVRGPDDFVEYGNLHFVASTESDKAAMQTKLPIPPNAEFHKGYLSSGVGLVDASTLIYPYTELTKKHKVTRQNWRNSYQTPPSEFHELKSGDLVVHFHNGIGKFLGIEKKKNHLGQDEEFMIIQYAEGGTLFAPLSQSHLISRYIGTSEEMPSLHKLGSTTWHKQKVKAQKAIIGYAQDLIKFQALREVHGGFSYAEDSDEMLQFEEDFPFNETNDQLKAIAEVKEDMRSSEPMDRLICGDVGYGKTEVAMRAAFKAVVDGGKQVAVLVPTTVLAMQHFETFMERMSNYPVRVGVLSRFVKPKDQRKTLEQVKEGSIDILVGTHRLISKDIEFNNLGLIIIDEEQRFGVRAKEFLKKMKVGVDCLTLSATPIPRTLYFSLVGARPMSVINTPPQDRLPIKSVIADRQPELIKNALQRELAHDGQAYFIHNRVESIYNVQKELEELLPAAKIAVVHGQMSPDQIDAVFHSFKSGITDILLATTIVESGIDIPNANTILIDRSHHYGLADLYQLRGRVGRWNKPAYCYFLTPGQRELPEISRKRLNALIESSGFGGGMKLAMRDLEIRGAGDLLGVQQSGNVATIGFHLYCKLLKRAIDTMKKNLQPDFSDVKMEFNYPASIPDWYVPETSLRIELYHRLGDALILSDIDDILAEITDRFGKPPEEVIWLYHLSRIRVKASMQQITFIKFGTKMLNIEMHVNGKPQKQALHFQEYADPQALEHAFFELLNRISQFAMN